MRPITLLFLLEFCFAAVYGRLLQDWYDDIHKDNNKNNRVQNSQWKYDTYNNIYHDPYESNNRKYDTEREYNSIQNQELLLSAILDQLVQFSSDIKASRSLPNLPQPQVVLVPVPYQMLGSRTGPIETDDKPDISSLSEEKNNEYPGQPRDYPETNHDNSDDGSRPVSLDPVKGNEPLDNPPPVEHGTSQAGITASPDISEESDCKIAVDQCCQTKNPSGINKCLRSYSCFIADDENASYYISVCKSMYLNYTIGK